jgi:hypothetical protein
VNKYAVHAHGENFYAKLLEIVVFLCDRRDLSSSDEGEITRIEAEKDPLSKIIGKFDVHEFTLMIGGSGKIRGFLTDHDHVLILLFSFFEVLLLHGGRFTDRSTGGTSAARLEFFSHGYLLNTII